MVGTAQGRGEVVLAYITIFMGSPRVGDGA